MKVYFEAPSFNPFDELFFMDKLKKLKNSFSWITLCLVMVFGSQKTITAQCLSATYGQWPGATYTPSCGTSCVFQTITADGYASEYSKVNVVNGNTYTFKSSVSADFITISNTNGAPSYTSGVGGVGGVTWIATFTGTVRFYTHTNSGCGGSTLSRTRSVCCVSPPPTPTCPTLSSPANAATNVTLSPTLSWTAGANSSSYDVYLSTDQNLVNTQNVSVRVSLNQAGTTYIASGLSASTTYYWRIVPKNSVAVAASGCSTFSFTTSAPSPTISAGSLTAFGNICVNSLSGANSFSVSGVYLIGNVILNALSGYAYSLSSSGPFTTTLSIPASGTLAATSVFVQFNPAAAAAYNGNISLTSSGATGLNVAASGTGVTAPTANAGADITLCPSQTSVISGSTNATSSSASVSSGTVTISGLDVTNPTATYTFTGLPIGAVINGITVNITSVGANCPSWYVVTTLINNAQQGAAGCTGTTTYTNFNGQAANGLQIKVRGQDNDAYPPGDFMTITYTVTLNYYVGVSPNPSYSWSPSTGLSASNILTPTCSALSTTNYTLTVTGTNGCSATDQVLVTVLPGASAGVLAGTQTACVGANTTFTSNGSAGGTWTSGSTGVATVNASTGIITGVSAGTSTITYTVLGAGGCPNATATRVVTVLALPAVNAGPDVTLCPSQTAVLGIPSGSSSTSPISSSASGNDNSNFTTSVTVTGAPSGATITSITFTPNLTYSGLSCYFYNTFFLMQYWNGSAWVNLTCGAPVTINAFNGSVANGLVFTIRVIDTDAWADFVTINISNLVANYTNPISYSWSPTTNLSSATVSNPTCSATATTTYTLTATANGCSAIDQAVVTVIPGAVAGTLSGTQSACVGATTTFTSNGSAGGTWTSSNTTVASVNPTTGIVTGVSAGTSTITYTVLGVSGCPNSLATRVVTVYAYPVINAGSDVTICPSSSTILIGTSNMTDSYVYTLNMSDSYGDGWNGGYLTAYVNSASIGTYSASGYGSSVSINVTAGQTIYFTYTTGSWEGENSYSISLNGTTVYSTGTNPPSGTVYTNNSHPQTATYAWSPGTSLSSTSTLSTTYTATTPTVATFTLTATANGCTSTDQVAITVQDLVPPVITCPSNVTVNSAPTSCGALVQYNAPTVTDDCAPNVLSANLLINGNGTAGLTSWNITQNGGNGWANSGETALGNGTSFIGSYAWCVKNQVVDLVANGYTTTQLDASPSIIVSEYYKANSCCSATDQYFFQAELLNSSFTPIANFNLGSIGSPVNSTAAWQQVNNTFAGYPSGVRYVRITHGSKDNEFWAGQYGTVINESKVQVFIPSIIAVVQTAGLTSGSTFPVGTTTNTFSATDATGNTSTNSFTVTVVDNVPPIANCQNLTVQLNASGTAAITASQINNNSTDNCVIAAVTVSPSAFTCANVGANTVTLTVTDIYGNSSTCNATVTVQDNIAPTVICQNITVQLNAAGNVSITAAQINNGSTDNCAIASVTVSPNSFTCANVGANAVTLTVTDVNGNSATCNATVTVQDNVAPVAICQNITAQLNASGNATITAAQVNNGSSDACGILSTTINASNFNCSNLGANTVVLTVTDNNNNSSTCSATVTVVDLINPFFITTPTNITNTAVANLCGRVIYYSQPTFGDNCSATLTKIDNSGLASGDIFPVGVTTQTYQITDQSGNFTVYSFTITIVDNQNPIITNCPSNITVNTSATSCNALVSWTAPAISDNCPGVQFTVSHTSGSQFSTGTTTVTYTATDASNNTSTCSFTVTVTDNVAPNVPVLSTITGVCSATATVPITQDNCSGTINGTTTNPLTYSTQGTHTITWTFTDANANSSTAIQTVIVLDNIAPTITAPTAVSAAANATCTATGVVLGTPVTNDNCSAVTIANNAPASFPLGQTVVTWTATDATGNSATAAQIVTVTDNTLPTITAPSNITVSANANCVAFNLNLGTPIVSDNCSIASVVNNGTAVYALGTTTVTWTVTDGSGNVRTATQTVTVVDNSNPVITAPAPKTVNANAGCTATGVNLGLPVASDNCSALVVTNNAPAAFPIGNTTVTWTATDNAGNIATATQVVTVLDNTNPTISAPSAVTVNANSTCTATGVVLGTPIASDNCTSIVTTNNAPASFPLGQTIVTWTVTDLAGNTATATQTVTVVDNQNPTIFAPATVNANTNNSCMALNVNLGTPLTSDNCSVATLVNNAPSAFNVGTTVVTWTVTDGSGLTATATQNVIVSDIEDPIIIAPPNINANTTSACSANGINLGTAAAFDNCSVATIASNAPASFPVGTTLVVWTATDANGNTSTATQTVVINDVVNPTITAPSDITTVTNSGCTASGIVIGVPQTADNCGVASVSNDAPVSFPVGITSVTWTVTDVNGNTAFAIQKVTVTDNIMPTLNVAANITVDANNSCVAFNVDLGAPVVADNCGIATLLNDAPTVYNIGTTTVTWIVTDNNGNSISATQTVTVVDNALPVIIAPANMQVSTNNNCVASGLNLGNPIATDNCTIATLVNDAPLDFPVGTTTVTYTVTDAAGNVATATQTITVSDLVNPTALLQNILVTLDGQGAATVSFADIDTGSSDNCGIATTTLSQTDFDCSDVGVNNITVIITDNNDNTTISTVSVTVKTDGVDTDSDGIDDSCDDFANPIEPEIPEAFTPNGNNINEYFVIGNLENFEQRQLNIYNRYGNSVYSSDNYQNDWDGTRSGNGQALPDATYYYVLKLSENDIRKGFVYINRVRQ